MVSGKKYWYLVYTRYSSLCSTASISYTIAILVQYRTPTYSSKKQENWPWGRISYLRLGTFLCSTVFFQFNDCRISYFTSNLGSPFLLLVFVVDVLYWYYCLYNSPCSRLFKGTTSSVYYKISRPCSHYTFTSVNSNGRCFLLTKPFCTGYVRCTVHH